MSTCATTDNDGTILKDPDDKLDYQNDWSTWLQDGDTIASSEWIITPEGLTQSDPGNTDTLTKIWLAGGEVGQTYSVTNRVTTSGGRIRDKTRPCYIVQR